MQRLGIAAVAASMGWLVACSQGGGGAGGDVGRGDRTPDAGLPDDAATPTGCDDTADADGDGIADAAEGDGDADGDGVPNRLDDDSDGDGVSDMDEARSDAPCAPADSDLDGRPDFLDTDSDDDGLTDAEEAEIGTDPTAVDTDGDGVTDLGEARGSGTDPLDPASTIPEGDFFVVLPFEEPAVTRTLRFGSTIQQADVFLLVDSTFSMAEEKANLIAGLVGTIVPGLRDAIPDVHIGVGAVEDYPVWDYGMGWSEPLDSPFRLVLSVTSPDADLGEHSVPLNFGGCPAIGSFDPGVIGTVAGGPNGELDVLEALRRIPCGQGMDGPESYVTALWATATGRGVSWPAGTDAERWPDYEWAGGSIPDRECPSIPDAFGESRGYPCFRAGSLPVVILFGDAFAHNGKDGLHDYDARWVPDAPSYDEAMVALNDVGARVLGVFSGSDAMDATDRRRDFESFAIDTGAVRPDGSPLVFDIDPDGTGLTGAVVDAVADLASETPQDVSTTTRNVAGNPDDFDATRFIASIVPVEGWRDGIAGPNPGVSYASKDETTFHGVIPGTLLDFEVTFVNEVREPADTAQIFRATIVVLGNGVATLDTRNVYVVVPPEGGVVLI